MRHWKKGMLALALCAALALGISIPASGAPGAVYLMAVNEKVVTMTAENMPTVMSGVLYVPYTMLSIRDTGINLGVSALYSTTRRTVLVSNGQIGIVFNIQNNSAEDLQGNPVSARAMVRNSMVFLPIDYLCGFFSTINCSRVRTDYGILIRVTNNAVVLRDLDFVDAASGQLEDNLRHYLASVEVPVPTSLPVPPTAAPTAPPPTAAPAVSDPPPPSGSEKPVESDPPVEAGAEAWLAFRWGEQGEDVARLLAGRREYALFLFTCEELRAQDDAVRRIAAAGHTIGLVLTGESGEECVSQLKEGRRLLAEIARYHVLVVSAGGVDGEGREMLAQEGCVMWDWDLRREDYSSGAALVEALDPQRANRVELACGPGDAAFLQSLLSAMDEGNCRLRQVTAPLLA